MEVVLNCALIIGFSLIQISSACWATPKLELLRPPERSDELCFVGRIGAIEEEH